MITTFNEVSGEIEPFELAVEDAAAACRRLKFPFIIE